MQLTDDGGYIIAGYTGSYGAGDFDYCLSKTDSLGNQLWCKVIGGIDYDGCQYVEQTHDGGYIAIGSSESYGAGGYDFYLVRLESEIPPAVTVTLTPITLPPNYLQFNIAVANNDSITVNFDVWTMVTLPNGSPYGPLIGPAHLTFPPGYSANRYLFQNIPAHAPAGTYTYEGYVGEYPDVIWDEDHFEFNIIAPFSECETLANDWNNWGESFDNLSTEISALNPDGYRLFTVYPNPFNSQTVIRYQITVDSYVELVVYDITGQEVQSLVSGYRSTGHYEIVFDSADLSSGIYFARLTAGDFTQTQKMVLIK